MKKKVIVALMAVIMIMAAVVVGCGTGATNGTENAPGKEDAAAGNEGVTQDENAESEYVKFPEFVATTIMGDDIDSSIFADADVTMVNIWGTFCGPCINEMPDLAELYGELPEGCALVGIVSDVYGEDNLDKAVKIVTETGVTYDNIIPDDVLYQFLAANVTGVPTTLYVDREGNILGGVVGARSKDDYKAILEELVKQLGVE